MRCESLILATNWIDLIFLRLLQTRLKIEVTLKNGLNLNGNGCYLKFRKNVIVLLIIELSRHGWTIFISPQTDQKRSLKTLSSVVHDWHLSKLIYLPTIMSRSSLVWLTNVTKYLNTSTWRYLWLALQNEMSKITNFQETDVIIHFNANHNPSKLISGSNKTLKLNYLYSWLFWQKNRNVPE